MSIDSLFDGAVMNWPFSLKTPCAAAQASPRLAAGDAASAFPTRRAAVAAVGDSLALAVGAGALLSAPGWGNPFAGAAAVSEVLGMLPESKIRGPFKLLRLAGMPAGLMAGLTAPPVAAYTAVLNGSARDCVVIDRSLEARHGDIVLAVVDGEFAVKTLFKRNGKVVLKPANPTFPDIVIREGQELHVWGVVTWVIKQASRRSASR